MTIRELCYYFGITTPTYYNWKKEKPNLFELINNFNQETTNNLANQKIEKMSNIIVIVCSIILLVTICVIVKRIVR